MQSPAEAEPVSRRFNSGLMASDAKLLRELTFHEVWPPVRVERVGISPEFNMALDLGLACIRQACPNRLAVRLVLPCLSRERPTSIAPDWEAMFLHPVA